MNPWGSGDDPHQQSAKHFLDRVSDLKSKGLSDKDIYEGWGMSSTQFRARKSMANAEHKQNQISNAQKLHDKGMSNVAAAAQMGIPESTFRSLLVPGAIDKHDQLMSISEMLKEEVDKNKFIDVGRGVENHVGVSKDRLNVALTVLTEQGYQIHPVNVKQVGTGHETRTKVLVGPGVTQKDAWLNRANIKQIAQVSPDQGYTFGHIDHPPISIKPKRIAINWAEDGGGKLDGVIYVRPGVKDVSLGKSRYAQVRIKVGDSHYLKGMAMYKDDLPDGIDLVFNTPKPRSNNKFDAMKPLTDDPLLPFGAVVNQITEHKGTDKEKVTSAMNIVNEEGRWKDWSRSISAQALSKQAPSLARAQLNMTYEARKADYDEIMALTNPAIRKKLLKSFAESVDNSAVHLKAAALDRQNWHVILPIDTMPPGKIYAPRYNNGETVALIRYPHGGTFEIPILTVDNRHPEAKKLLGDTPDAVGIHHTVAERLSGADFDGDTVLVIPNDKGHIKATAALDGLKNFNPKDLYKNPEGVEFKGNKQQLMGDISNLITDMTLRAAPPSDIARAVRHSMVVIDADKKNLNYRQSAIDNGIRALKEKYQGRANAGASTLISLAKSKVYVPDRKDRPFGEGGPIDQVTGERRYVPTGKTRFDVRSGERVPKLTKSRKLAETTDAHTLSSGTPMETIYANHSNKLKALANKARLDLINTPPLQRSPSAARTYAAEVESLNSKLFVARKNSPRERQAQVVANEAIALRRAANPDLSGDTLKKIRYQEQEKARARMGAKKRLIEISPKEWDAIQAGAISNSKLTQILDNADLEIVKTLATPHPERLMTSVKTERATQMLLSGYSRAEVAKQLGVSVSTLDAATIGDGQEEDS